MDYIKKTICLDGERTRTQGIMPYYEFGTDNPSLTPATGNNGNWGQFVANPDFLTDSGKTYNGMMHSYYSLLNMVRNGIHLRRVGDGDNAVFTENLSSFVWSGTCFADGNEPDSVYEYDCYAASDFIATEISNQQGETIKVYKYIGTEAIPESSYIVIVNDFGKFVNLSSYLNDMISGDEHTRWGEYCSFVDKCIGKINIPASIYNKHIKAPKSIPCADVVDYISWLVDNENLSGNCCNARLWDDMGGDDMLEFLKTSAETKCEEYREFVDEFTYTVPYIEMPLLLVQNFTDVGVLTNVDGVEYNPELNGPSAREDEETRPHGYLQLSSNDSGFTLPDPERKIPDGRIEISGITISGLCLTIDQVVMKNKRMTYPVNETGEIVVESLLRTLRDQKKYTDDEDNVLPGLFKKYDDAPSGKYFICEKNGDEWVVSPYTGNDLKNGDGMTSEEAANVKFYRTVTTEASAKRISEVYDTEPKEDGEPEPEFFYYKVKYENSESATMTIPYKKGNTANVYFIEDGEDDEYVCRGDFISEEPIITGDKIEFKYVIGGYFTADSAGTFINYIGSGDVYYEKYKYESSHLIYVTLDGVDNVPIYSEYIDFDASMKEFYSPSLNLYRYGNTANIIEATTGEIWNEDYSYDAYLTKEEYLTNFSSPPKVDVDVTIDRGGVSAFEKHYKLSECNTMQDLTQYGNNYFNLQ